MYFTNCTSMCGWEINIEIRCKYFVHSFANFHSLNGMFGMFLVQHSHSCEEWQKMLHHLHLRARTWRTNMFPSWRRIINFFNGPICYRLNGIDLNLMDFQYLCSCKIEYCVGEIPNKPSRLWRTSTGFHSDFQYFLNLAYMVIQWFTFFFTNKIMSDVFFQNEANLFISFIPQFKDSEVVIHIVNDLAIIPFRKDLKLVWFGFRLKWKHHKKWCGDHLQTCHLISASALTA